jgi:hypothetical protein
MKRTQHPQTALTAVLDLLERELLAAYPEDVREAWRETGGARKVAYQEVRALLDEAFAASEDGFAAPPPDTYAGLDRLLGLSRQLRSAASTLPAWICRRH